MENNYLKSVVYILILCVLFAGCNFEDTALDRPDTGPVTPDMTALDMVTVTTDMPAQPMPDMPAEPKDMPADMASDLLDMALEDLAPDLVTDMPAVESAGFYVDCESTRAGDGLSQDDPINTLADLDVALREAPLAPGQGIYFRSGSRCEGSLSMIVRDQPDGAEPIVISIYGGEEPATIDVSKSVDTWERLSEPPSVGGVSISYLESAPVYTVTETAHITQVFRDGERLPLAARADACNMRASWLAQSVTPFDEADPVAPRTITIAQPDGILQYPATDTMRAVLRLSDFDYGVATRIDSVSFENRTMTIADMPERYSAGYAVELQNWLPLLTCDGEWMQDEQTAYLFALSLGDIRVSTRDPDQSDSALEGADGIQLRLGQNAHVVIEHMRIERAARTGVWARSITERHGHITLNDVHIEDPAEHAVNTYGISSTTITASTLSGAPSDCVRVGQQRALSVTGSDFEDCGFVHTQDTIGVQLSGISVGNVETLEISDNRFRHMGFAAVSMGGITGEGVVNQNVIQDYCLYLNDCGAIYTNGGRDVARVADGQIRYANNLIVDGLGYIEGTPKAGTGEHSARGVYLDWRRSGVTVDRNVIVNAPSRNGAIFIHGGEDNIISRNTIIQADAAGIAAAVLTNDIATQMPTEMSGNILTDNTLYIESRDKGVIRLTDSVSGAHDTRPGGMIDMTNNALYNPLIDETLALDTRNQFGAEQLTSSHSNLSLQNRLTGIYEASMGAGNHSRVFVNDQKSPANIPLMQDYCDLDGAPVTGNVTVPGRSAVVLLRCFCNQDNACNNLEDATSCPADCNP